MRARSSASVQMRAGGLASEREDSLSSAKLNKAEESTHILTLVVVEDLVEGWVAVMTS